ncbi:hypothetical protein FRB90_004206 [Tulasnella sp. 427]|nr:hypothetical protein FRB90_004206 [Tulasnella sp. 427]
MARDRTIPVPPSSAPAPSGILRVSGDQIVGADGKPVILRGAGLGGHLNMENFITGYPGHEHEMRRAMKAALGEEKYDFFFDKFLEYFFTEADAKFFASLGFNCIRIPFNYRHFEDDMNPGVYLDRGFQWLDRIINICAAEGIYTILDLHSAPGGQNPGWHCDTGIQKSLFWEHIEFQNRAIALWEALAARYMGNTWVAGYNPLNEPCDEEHTRMLAWYDRVEKAIHKIDPDHIVSSTLIEMKSTKLVSTLETKVEYQKKHNVPVWNGEWGPVYASPDDGPDWEEVNKDRYHLVKDQLKLYEDAKISWSIWLYKDIGFQGMVYPSPESEYMKLLRPFLAKKKQYALDAWGCDSKRVADIFQPIEHWMLEGAPNLVNRYPVMGASVKRHIGRVLREMLLSEAMTEEYASYFASLSDEQLDKVAASFKFENCVQRKGLNDVIRPK